MMACDDTLAAHAPQDAPHLRLRDLGKVYRSAKGDLPALKGVDLDVRHGDFFSVLGPSGCGKSTVLRCLAGLEAASSGTVEIDGTIVRGPPEKLGMVFQRDVLLDWRTVLDNVLLPAEFHRPDRTAALRPKAMELLRLVGLGDYLHRHPWELSGGMRQRAAICRALLEDPTLLLMDEPFGALDEFTRDQLNLELQRIWTRTRSTVVFITHSIAEAILLSSRVAVMARNPGRVVEVLDIDLPRPRTLLMRESARFIEYSAHLRAIFDTMELGRT